MKKRLNKKVETKEETRERRKGKMVEVMKNKKEGSNKDINYGERYKEV